MARPKFTPDDEQSKTLAALARVGKQRAKLDAEADRLITTAHNQQIPILAVADTLNVTRKTVYRHQGRKMK